MLKDENAEVFCQPAFDRNNTLMGKIRGDSNTRNSTTFCLGCNKGKRFNKLLRDVWMLKKMTKTILTKEQKKQVVNLLRKGIPPKEISELLGFPMRSIGSIKSHLTMGTYDEN